MNGIGLGGVMVLNPTFNNISVISWWSVLLEEQVTDKLHHIMLNRGHLAITLAPIA